MEWIRWRQLTLHDRLKIGQLFKLVKVEAGRVAAESRDRYAARAPHPKK